MMRARSLAGAALAVAALAAAAGTHFAAHAHTAVRIVANQYVLGGYVSGYGLAPNQQIDDGPVTDGTVNWQNYDDWGHAVVGICVSGPCMTAEYDPVTKTWGPKKISLVVPSGEAAEIHDYPEGAYEYGDPGFPHMQGRFRVS